MNRNLFGNLIYRSLFRDMKSFDNSRKIAEIEAAHLRTPSHDSCVAINI